ncbi:MAG: TatD family hydrolase [Actinomycetaceae bacterium]|nr:TatD family hydrolase [Arcanobacterium sp.]MDD7505592.1 TatD family hydrolase [Actinomycetaceae bacterium]MDY6143790.1 TatD family hydrolase [Arcanobacterium sp.]
MARKKANVPDFRPLNVPIVDNHTHIRIDSQHYLTTGYNVDAEYLDGSASSPTAHNVPASETGALAAESDASTSQAYGRATRPERQNYTESGKLAPPILESTLIGGMDAGGIRAAITSGCSIPELVPTVGATRRHPGRIYAALAIHPNDAPLHAGVREQSPDGATYEQEAWHEDFSLDRAIEEVARLAVEPEVVAVGETGLDYFRTGDTGRAAQVQSFREHIALAKDLGKPLQIHDREAHRDVVDVLLRDGAPERTVFHSFSGDAELAQVLASNGWYASFSGPLTYPANRNLREAFCALPAELILVETDAPYLTPVPYRGHPNSVWGASYTAIYMAWLRGDPEARAIVDDATNAEVEAAWLSTSDEIIDAWCVQLNRNTRAVYNIG